MAHSLLNSFYKSSHVFKNVSLLYTTSNQLLKIRSAVEHFNNSKIVLNWLVILNPKKIMGRKQEGNKEGQDEFGHFKNNQKYHKLQRITNRETYKTKST